MLLYMTAFRTKLSSSMKSTVVELDEVADAGQQKQSSQNKLSNIVPFPDESNTQNAFELDSKKSRSVIRDEFTSLSINGPSIEDIPEIWARTISSPAPSLINQTRERLSASELGELRALCSRCLLGTIFKGLKVQDAGHMTYVQTGDINSMWLRDSSVQMGIYYPYIVENSALRFSLEGTIRKLANGVIHDPYANSYSQEWIDPNKLSKRWRMIGRGGHTGT